MGSGADWGCYMTMGSSWARSTGFRVLIDWDYQLFFTFLRLLLGPFYAMVSTRRTCDGCTLRPQGTGSRGDSEHDEWYLLPIQLCLTNFDFNSNVKVASSWHRLWGESSERKWDVSGWLSTDSDETGSASNRQNKWEIVFAGTSHFDSTDFSEFARETASQINEIFV